jgi:uncharacterized protein (TIGR03435 family)
MKWLPAAVTLISLSPAMPAQQPAFDVATVKPSISTAGINNRHDPLLATWTNAPLSFLIESAYEIQSDQLIGGPAWLKSDHWDIVGKTDATATSSQQVQMLRTLLADRFKLKVHRETRSLPEYELAVARGGPKIHEALPNSTPNSAGRTRIETGLIDGHEISIAQFTYWLRGELGRPVIDRTGLMGKYDIKLQWVPDESQPNSGGEAPPPDSVRPSLFAAIQDLGLNLKAVKGPVDVLVIDHLEKPSAN